ncbi:MAG: hypothetical protein AAB701_00280 [Patescibacteria group bacterium]
MQRTVLRVAVVLLSLLIIGCSAGGNLPATTTATDAELMQTLERLLNDPEHWPTALEIKGQGYTVFGSSRQLEHGLKTLLDTGLATMDGAKVRLTKAATPEAILAADQELAAFLQEQTRANPPPVALPVVEKPTPPSTIQVAPTLPIWLTIALIIFVALAAASLIWPVLTSVSERVGGWLMLRKLRKSVPTPPMPIPVPVATTTPEPDPTPTVTMPPDPVDPVPPNPDPAPTKEPDITERCPPFPSITRVIEFP